MELIDKNGQPKFGSCFRCGSPISIPGIDIYTCSQCGFVETPEYHEFLFRTKKRDECKRKTRNCSTRKRQTVEGMSAASDEDSESSLFLEAAD